MNWFLKAKHWQLFVLVFAAPLVLEVIGLISVALTRGNPTFLFICAFIMMGIILFTQFGWFHTVGKALGEKLPPNAGMNVKRFRTFVLIPVFYISAVLFLMLLVGLFVYSGGEPSPFMLLLLIIVIPMHFFSIFCIFYSIWFIAKSLKMVERWNHVELGDYIGDFFLVWFFFIGIWFIQPRINRLFDPSLPPSPPPQYPNYPNYPPQYPNQYPQGYPPQYPPQGYQQPPNYPPQYPPQQ